MGKTLESNLPNRGHELKWKEWLGGTVIVCSHDTLIWSITGLENWNSLPFAPFHLLAGSHCVTARQGEPSRSILGWQGPIYHTAWRLRGANTRSINTYRPKKGVCPTLNLEQKVNGTVMFLRTKAKDWNGAKYELGSLMWNVYHVLNELLKYCYNVCE
jgi:hypothetical protein